MRRLQRCVREGSPGISVGAALLAALAVLRHGAGFCGPARSAPARCCPVPAASQMRDADPACDGRRLRVVSYNVCGLGAGFGPPDNDAVTRAYGLLLSNLRRLKADVVCLQEARRLPIIDPTGREREDSLDALASDLGMQLRFSHATPGFEKFGNAILVGPALELLDSGSVHLAGGSVVRTPAGAEKKIVRGCVATRLALQEESDDPDLVSRASQFAVLATHWDHISEAERVIQADSLLASVADLTGGLPHLLVGDLNAMKRADYTSEEWSALQERNAQRGWAPLEDSRALAALEASGYSDLLSETLASPAGAASAAAAAPAAPLAAGRFTAPRQPPVRIDFAYASRDWGRLSAGGEGGGAGARGAAASAWVDASAEGSDHLPLVVDAVLR
ncbi:unnamed protein product [Prorocentrum cordatum]|uniref:Endonuclease/exonuclease/phosphatase domain-containing protein n=1 Tax=Prorocentrum cordatum TaxID=2364126 RepID=A0ABN9P6Q9_9DINO|nr:unnamed protein product [Polarella glacialis]